MHPALVPAVLVLSGALALAVYVGSYRERSQLHWLLLAALLALATWALGALCRFSVTTEVGLQASLRLLFLGVFTTPPLWLALAASYAQLRIAARREFLLALLAPSALTYGALITNDGHHLVMREETFAAMEAGGVAWAGPLFWIFLAWAWTCLLGGVFLYLRTAGRMVVGQERRRGLLLALASAIPLLISPIYMLRLLPISFDLTPTALLLSLAIISAAVFRYRLLLSLPVARRDVIEHLEDGVLMASQSGVILDLNPAAERILGQSAQSVRRRLLSEVLADQAPPEKRDALRNALSELHTTGEPVSIELRRSDDRRITLDAGPARDGSGAAAGQFAVLRDRTDERRFERLLRRTQRLQTAGTLAAGVAHEVNNPLAFIRANLGQVQRMGELVERSGDGDDAKLAEELLDLRAIADETLDGISRIERIVGDMRRLAADPSEELPRDPVDVNAVVRDALRLANLHRRQVVEVRLLLEPELPPVAGSSERLVQALLNLLLNARQAVENAPRPRISVATERGDGHVVIRVSDNGPGIPLELQERIFDPFFTTKGPDRGTGLGLPISFDIVREHGGALEVRSRPGGGAAFVAHLPMAAEATTP